MALGPDGHDDDPVMKPHRNSDGSIGEENEDKIEERREARAAAEKDAADRAFASAMQRNPWLGAPKHARVRQGSAPRVYLSQEFAIATVWAMQFQPSAFEVHGNIRERFNQIGGALGLLGCPLTDETSARDGVGRFNDFERGAIYWTHTTPAREIYGDIRILWHNLDAEHSFLGYPLSAERSVGNGRVQDFQRGQIFWSPSSPACALPAAIAAKYASLGGPLGSLGFPVTNEIPTGTGMGTKFRFQRGKILWQGTVEPITVLIDPVYNFSIDKIQCLITRSRSTNTLHITAAVAVFGRDTIAVTKSLGDHKEGFIYPGIVLPNVALADEDAAVCMYAIMNSGHVDESEVRRKMEDKVKDLATSAANFAGDKVGALIGNEIAQVASSAAIAAAGAYIGGILGVQVPALGQIIGAALGALTGWVMGGLVDLLNPNCDGMVAAATLTVVGMELRDKVAVGRPLQKTDTIPGSDSAGGCGRNSLYMTSWSVSQVS